MIQGAWRAWLDYLQRVHDEVTARREGREIPDMRYRPNETRKTGDTSWRVPTEDESNADLKGWKGQGLIEYAFVLLLVAAIVIVIIALMNPKQYTYPMPTDVCPNTQPHVVESEPSWGLKQVTIDYIDVNGNTVHLLWSQPQAGRPFQLYARDIDPGDDCPR